MRLTSQISFGSVVNWLRNRADNVAVGLLTAMFVSFLLQIFFRYVVNQPLTWTLEANLLAWLWVVFWVSAFLLKERDHVRFDTFYLSARPPLRRAFAIISALLIVVGFGVAFPATLDFILFMKIESSSSLGIRLDIVFSVYLIFAAALITRYTIRTVRIIRGADVDER